MKHKCIIVDDEPLARELLVSHLSHFADFELLGTFENAIRAYEHFASHKTDLIFLDIEMPLIKGNDFLKKLAYPPKVILTTAFREYALEGYELNVVDYLLKPITFERFFRAIEKYRAGTPAATLSTTAGPEAEHIFIPSGNRNIKVTFEEIFFIESFRDYISIHLRNGSSHSVKLGISAFEACLPVRFKRIHRSFIINVDHIQSFSRSEVEINGRQLPVGESYADTWKEVFNDLSARKFDKKKG